MRIVHGPCKLNFPGNHESSPVHSSMEFPTICQALCQTRVVWEESILMDMMAGMRYSIVLSCSASCSHFFLIYINQPGPNEAIVCTCFVIYRISGWSQPYHSSVDLRRFTSRESQGQEGSKPQLCLIGTQTSEKLLNLSGLIFPINKMGILIPALVISLHYKRPQITVRLCASKCFLSKSSIVVWFSLLQQLTLSVYLGPGTVQVQPVK